MTTLITWPDFMNPGRLWALAALPLLIIAYLVILRLKGRTGIRFTNTSVLAAILPKQSQWRRHVAVAMSLCSLVALAMAWARPLGVENVPRERATIVVVIDASLSMKATDVKPNRLDAAKEAATAFIDSLPAKFNVSVVKLSGNPSIVMPPSTDRGATKRAVGAIQLEESTAIGGAIETALKAIRQAPPGDGNQPAPGLIVLLSDGMSNVGESPLQAAEAAKKAEVPVHTIAYGTDNGYVDVEGQRERVAPDKQLLRQIAQTTGGQAWAADDASQLSQVYSEVKSEVGFEQVKKERTAQYALYALAFATVAALGAVSMAARWP